MGEKNPLNKIIDLFNKKNKEYIAYHIENSVLPLAQQRVEIYEKTDKTYYYLKVTIADFLFTWEQGLVLRVLLGTKLVCDICGTDTCESFIERPNDEKTEIAHIYHSLKAYEIYLKEGGLNKAIEYIEEKIWI